MRMHECMKVNILFVPQLVEDKKPSNCEQIELTFYVTMDWNSFLIFVGDIYETIWARVFTIGQTCVFRKNFSSTVDIPEGRMYIIHIDAFYCFIANKDRSAIFVC